MVELVKYIAQALVEKPVLDFTALDAAETVAHALDSDSIEWRSIDQTADERRGVFTATAEFGLTIILTNPTERN